MSRMSRIFSFIFNVFNLLPASPRDMKQLLSRTTINTDPVTIDLRSIEKIALDVVQVMGNVRSPTEHRRYP